MNLTKSNKEFGHNTNKICNVKANVDDMKKLTYTHSIICDGGSHELEFI
jgi:hypothetical protein